MSSNDDVNDRKRRNDKDRCNVRKSRGDHNRISKELSGSKRSRFGQEAQKELSISDRKTRYPNRYYNLPPMMPIRHFPIAQDYFIIDNRSLAEHIEHKWHFQRIQLNNFFVKHKDKKWFKNKYHPDDIAKEKEKLTIVIGKRLEVFKEFLENGKIDSVSVDAENPGPLIRLLDSVIIKLEGGKDFDLTVLNPTEKSIIQKKSQHEKKETNKKTNTDENSDGVLDSDKKVGEETNIKDKYVVNKNNEAMNVDVKKPEIFDITNNNDLKLHGNKLGVNDIKKYKEACIIPVNGITNHFQVARNDIKLCVSIINHFDNRSGLWQSIDGEQSAMETTYGVVSRNPVLNNIIDFITDEASAEEEELLGKRVSAEHEVNTEKHVQLLKALDRMILYLRIVHSVDFYDYTEYAHEDGMPIKCNIMHARLAPTLYPPTKREIASYCHYFRPNADSLMVSTNGVSERELILLGSRDEEEEVKKFIDCNTQKVSTDKWLCQLSGKKFKSPEFVRKHIIRKYTDVLNDLKKEVKYFNNYLRDPNRPQPFPRSRPAPNL